jgi:branched-chain amino acid transport system ATP-binding protein
MSQRGGLAARPFSLRAGRRRSPRRAPAHDSGALSIARERRNQLAGTLSGGEQQMLAIGRGVASAPDLLMLDEPSMGLAPAVADTIFERIREIHRARGLTVLLVEQRVVEAIEACDHGYVLETERIVLHGPYDTLLSDARVQRAYLGI